MCSACAGGSKEALTAEEMSEGEKGRDMVGDIARG